MFNLIWNVFRTIVFSECSKAIFVLLVRSTGLFESSPHLDTLMWRDRSEYNVCALITRVSSLSLPLGSIIERSIRAQCLLQHSPFFQHKLCFWTRQQSILFTGRFFLGSVDQQSRTLTVLFPLWKAPKIPNPSRSQLDQRISLAPLSPNHWYNSWRKMRNHTFLYPYCTSNGRVRSAL